MGREFMKAVLKYYDLIEDPLIIDYVNRVGRHIASVFPNRNFTYRFYVIKEDVYNAFAAPAGHVFINSGLFGAMENEEELAGILAHEIAHVECRHISQKIERSSKINMIALAGIAAGIFLGVGGMETAASALSIGSIAAGQSLSLSYSREDEMQADQLGLKYIAAAGYSGSGLLTMLKKIRGTEWFGSDQVPTYLRTHPASEDRIAYIGTWLDSNKTTVKPNSNPDGFNMAHTKLVAVYGEEVAALRRFKAAIDKDPEDSIANYGLGMVYARLGNREKAEFHMKTALKNRAFDSYMLSDLGKIYFLNGQYSQALIVLKDAVQAIPYNPDAFFYLGRTELEVGEFQKAVFVLENLVQKKPDYASGHYFLGEAYGKMGQLGDAHYYLGIFYKNKGELRTAMFHLEKASEHINDPVMLEKIKEMLKEVRKTGKNQPKRNL